MGKKRILPWRRKTLEKVRDAIPENVSFDAWIIAVEMFEASTFNSFVKETERDLRTGTWDNSNDLAPFVTVTPAPNVLIEVDYLGGKLTIT